MPDPKMQEGKAERLRVEVKSLKAQLTDAHALLRDIYMTCNLREMPSEYAIGDISNRIEALLKGETGNE